jgi:hypothetical protein
MTAIREAKKSISSDVIPSNFFFCSSGQFVTNIRTLAPYSQHFIFFVIDEWDQ